jgi:hypothetical protein
MASTVAGWGPVLVHAPLPCCSIQMTERHPGHPRKCPEGSQLGGGVIHKI